MAIGTKVYYCQKILGREVLLMMPWGSPDDLITGETI